MSLEVPSHAKINWTLRVTGRRPDGFHDLETIFQEISLHDELWFTETEDALSLVCDDPSIPVDDRNLVLLAARAVGAPQVTIELKKRIPAGGGLGGGSSNAATTLLTLDRMFDLQRNDLPKLALELGSDVPFFLAGGTAYATGRGELLTPLPSMAGIHLLLLLPSQRVLTRDAFARITRYSTAMGLEAARDAAARRDYSGFTNDFEEPVFAMLPELGVYKQRMLDAGAEWAAMSGSGSTIVGAFNSRHRRDAARRAFGDVTTVVAETL